LWIIAPEGKVRYNLRYNEVVMQHVKLVKIGNSVGVILPKDVLMRLNVTAGEQLTLTEAPDGVRLSAFDPKRSEELERARAIMAKRRHALRELAK
jgi:putative addiction module antidote